MFKTTAIYHNRIQDKEDLEEKLGLSEEGNQVTEFYNRFGSLLFKGYERIVYGDHGPYIEFKKENICCKLISRFNNVIDIDNLPGEDYKYFYYWLCPSFDSNIKVYLQIKTVHNLPNAPKRNDGKPSSFNRKEGYADYKRGFFYVDPYCLKACVPGVSICL